eukprot:COSAG01_NODE_29659_length_632_cov_2.932458_1_plen_78_part_10
MAWKKAEQLAAQGREAKTERRGQLALAREAAARIPMIVLCSENYKVVALSPAPALQTSKLGSLTLRTNNRKLTPWTGA